MTEQIDYDPNTVLEALNNKADRDLNNVTDGTYQVLTIKNITNCITKIPQDIKLELNDGTLTLKAGSKVYDGNGNVINITSDIKRTDASVWSSISKALIISSGATALDVVRIERSFSGDTAPASPQPYDTWYDTTNNVVKRYIDGSWTGNWSLSLGIFNGSNMSIDQVFNGFGYIGNTIFALPGVEGLIPNGRNTDGSLNNTKFVTDRVTTLTRTSTNTQTIAINTTLGYPNIDTWSIAEYDSDKNINYRTDTNKQVSLCFCGILSRESGRITSFNPKTAFQVIDRNDKEEIVSWGMPDLTAGVNLTSGTTIPVNSLVYVASTRSAGNLARAYLDGEEMFKNEGGASTSDGSGATFLAPENSIYTSSGNFDKQIYYPLKGEI